MLSSLRHLRDLLNTKPIMLLCVDLFGSETPSAPAPLLAAGSSDVVSPTQTMLKKFKNSRNLTSTEKEVYKEIRRQSHISAEQKRRGSIKVLVYLLDFTSFFIDTTARI